MPSPIEFLRSMEYSISQNRNISYRGFSIVTTDRRCLAAQVREIFGKFSGVAGQKILESPQNVF
jgi:hypothetical protein